MPPVNPIWGNHAAQIPNENETKMEMAEGGREIEDTRYRGETEPDAFLTIPSPVKCAHWPYQKDDSNPHPNIHETKTATSTASPRSETNKCPKYQL